MSIHHSDVHHHDDHRSWEVGMYAVYLQEGRTPHAAAGHSNAPKYTATHSSTVPGIPVPLHISTVQSTNIYYVHVCSAINLQYFQKQYFSSTCFRICVYIVFVLYLYGMCWWVQYGAIKICHLIMAHPGPAESQHRRLLGKMAIM